MDTIFEDIVDIQCWQTIQDNFSNALWISLRTINPRGIFLTHPSGPARISRKLLQDTIEKSFDEQLHHTLLPFEINWKEGIRCYDNFYIFIIPLKVSNETIAYIIVGPVIVGKRHSPQHYRELAKTFSVDEGKFLDAIRDIKTFSFHGINLVLELIHKVASSLCQMGYQDMKLKMASVEIPPLVEKVYAECIEKLLNAFLEITFTCSRADRGSLMLFDEDTNELYIKIAKGLKQEIIDNVRLKMGEGLAGLAAKEEKTLVIDKHMRDKRILSRLHNPALKQSLLIPLKVKQKIFGILNLGAEKEEASRFSSEEITRIDKLTELVETTISNLPERTF